MRLAMICSLGFLFVLLSKSQGASQKPDGEAIFNQRCAKCHGSKRIDQAPSLEGLRLLGSDRLDFALGAKGPMASVGAQLSAGEKEAVIQYLGRSALNAENIPLLPASAFCAPGSKWDPHAGSSWVGWSPDLTNSRFQSKEAAGLSPADVSRLKLKWAFALHHSRRVGVQPSVLGGRLFVGSAGGEVYSLDAKSGCIYWVNNYGGEIRNAVELGPVGKGSHYAIFFGDRSAKVTAIDAETGKLLWKVTVDDQPSLRITGSVKYFQGRVYVPVTTDEERLSGLPDFECCKARGALVALDAATGKQIWKTYTISEKARQIGKTGAGTLVWGPAGVGIWNSPTIDPKKNLIYVGTGNSTSPPTAENEDSILAMDLRTGKVRWRRKFTFIDGWNMMCDQGNPAPVVCPNPDAKDEDFGASMILVTLPDGRRLLVGPQKTALNVVDPDHEGGVVFRYADLGIKWGASVSGSTAFVGGVRGVRAVRLEDGKILQTFRLPSCQGRSACNDELSAALTTIPGAVFASSKDGRIFAYDSSSGSVLWEFDTRKPFNAVDGIPAYGGEIDGPGAVVVGGMVYQGSGYLTGVPGNVLLAFSVDGK